MRNHAYIYGKRINGAKENTISRERLDEIKEGLRINGILPPWLDPETECYGCEHHEYLDCMKCNEGDNL